MVGASADPAGFLFCSNSCLRSSHGTRFPCKLLLSGSEDHQRLEPRIRSSMVQNSHHDPTGRRNFLKCPPDSGSGGPSSLKSLHVFSQQAGGLPQAVNPEGRMEPRPQFRPEEYFAVQEPAFAQGKHCEKLPFNCHCVLSVGDPLRLHRVESPTTSRACRWKK